MLFKGGPTIFKTTLGSSPSTSSKISIDPPLTLRKGRMPFKTCTESEEISQDIP